MEPSIKRKLVEELERDVVRYPDDIETAIMSDMFRREYVTLAGEPRTWTKRIEYRVQRMHSLQREVEDIINSSTDALVNL